jgi:phosphocarrier protein HPr
MTERQVTIRNRAGIHARPAALIVQTAGRFASRINFIKDSETINAKSIMGIITLGASYNTSLTIRAEGDDELQAVESLVGLFEKRFEED